MITRISNGLVTAQINHKGAELTSLFHQALGLEYMWNADPKHWAKSSPVLFPIVGALRDGTYLFKGEQYSLPRHGFARDMEFELESKDASSATFLLVDNEQTKKVYPFSFELRIIYTIEQFTLNVIYEVKNLSSNQLYFSIGAHPAFRVPLIAGTSYEDYYLKFEKPESTDRWPITSDGLISNRPQAYLRDQEILPLRKDLFYTDALVFKGLASSVISIRSKKHTHGLDLTFDGFPFFGIWASKDADFVCLEPWCGIADREHNDQHLEKKVGIHILAPRGTWARTWSVKCY